MNFKSLITSTALIAGLTATTATTAQAADWTLSTDFVGEYVFRGVTLGAESIQPGVEVSFDNGFTAGIWGTTGVGEQSIANGDEIDFYVGYGFGLTDKLSADVGATLYHYPQLGNVFEIGEDEAGTLEVYGGIGLDAAFAPSLYAYYDTTLETFTLEGGVENSFGISTGPASFDVSATVGLVEPEEGDGYQYGSISAALSYAITESASGYIGLTGVVSSEDTLYDTDFDLTSDDFDGFDFKSSTVYYSIGLSTGF